MRSINAALDAYFFGNEGGPDLYGSLDRLPLAQMDRLVHVLQNRSNDARVFFMGNGGSYDNARLMAQCSRAAGINARTPGSSEDYLQVMLNQDYGSIFSHGLAEDRLRAQDIVIVLSGSGNSSNIIKALHYSRQAAAQCLFYGGRDGGKAITVCGDEQSLIAPADNMELIEDLHVIMHLIILRALSTGTSCRDISDGMCKAIRSFLHPTNRMRLEQLATGIYGSMHRGGRCIVIGCGIGANHCRADLGRGATNAMPIRGIACPELFTENSLQATANDDGSDFILVDGLVKLDCNATDFALICNIDGQRPYEYCMQELQQAQTPFICFGDDGIDISMFGSWDPQFLISLLGHACSYAIREHLRTLFHPRMLDLDISFPVCQKKLCASGTRTLEDDLKTRQQISADECITFCYGNTFAVRSLEQWTRCYY